MSGFRGLGGPLHPGDGRQLIVAELDEYYNTQLQNPAINTAWFAAGTTAGTTAIPLVQTNLWGDYPRNAYYNFTGGTTGGTFVGNFVDQFGVAFTETVSQGSTGANASVYGTGIAAKYISGSFFPNTSVAGTYTIGYGTASNGSAQSNWFGLLTKVGGSADLKWLRWVNNGTATALNKGTALGTLINTTTHSFQGTAGVTATDTYDIWLKPSFDNNQYGTMCNL